MGTTVGVVGTGNMGGAMVRGWLRDPHADLTVLAYDVIPELVEALMRDVRVKAAATVEELAATSVIVIAVKPKIVASALEALRPYLTGGTIIISLAAGVGLDTVQAAAGPAAAVFRIMPNLGVEMGEGVIAVTAASGTTPEQVQTVTELLAPLGLVETVSEDLFDAVTAVSGSGIGFLALMMEGMEDGAVRAGLPRPMARAFVRQTALATSLLLQRHPGSAADIKDQVSSPAGTTIAGLAVLEGAGVRAAFIGAVEQATARARALRDVTGASA